ncbi:hypothetical protein HG536_0C01820 [Torulaspora globosa]|uniref:Major facilitator superfamily (MFS) profile domain-containing protein n=1 Tax=Torulaspora globosa TaxID=48254 RepID=A0A7G3ZES8_9SACH|nr:uncharacterized protein HG536_0C01820 [Torulaspora globosa]QLL32014.1 hypothetical protein HG536_0C01820 [Torulaspora globosa]
MGRKDKQRNKLRQFTKQKQSQKAKKSDQIGSAKSQDSSASIEESVEYSEETETDCLLPIRREILQDPSTELPGFVAEEIAEQEQVYRESQEIANGYGSIARKDDELGTPATAVGVAEEPLSKARLQVIMLSMYLGIFLAAIDNTIVSTTAAHVASEFKELPRVAWIATAYLLSSATFQPLYGKLSDIFGRRCLLIFTNIAFLIGCLMCGISRSFWWLVVSRFIAGVGGGGVTSMSSITITDIVPLSERALYQGTCNIFYGLGTACGGIVGGWFSDNWGGWRMAFLVQVPLSAISLFMIVLYLRLPVKANENASGRSMRQKLLAIDWFGALALVVFLALFLMAASLGGKELAYASKTFALLIILSSLALAVFVYAELRVAKDPILPLRFLSNRSVLGSSLSNWFCMMATMTTSYYLPIYFSGVLNMSPTDIGKRLTPNFFSVAFGSLGAGYYMKKTRKYYWFVLFFCAVAVLGQLQILLIDPHVSTWRQFTLTLVPGFGSSVLITVALLAMIAVVPHKHQAATTSISYAFRSTGCVLGVALGGAIFRESLSSLTTRRVLAYLSDSHPREELLKIIQKSSTSSEWVHNKAPQFIRPVLIDCYNAACKNTFLFCLLCSLLALLSISIIEEKKLHSSLQRKEQDAQDSQLLA